MVTKDLRYYIDDKEVAFGRVEPELNALITENTEPELVVILQADKTPELQHVVDLVDIGNKLQIKMVLYAKKPK